jgi:quercetin dioxygenase-like cupin family protein
MLRQPSLLALRRSLAGALISLAAAAPSAAGADEKPAAPPVQPNVLFSAPLADMPGKQLVVLELRVPPKPASAPERPRTPHQHPGSVYIHVTQGAVRFGLEGEPVQTVSAGGSFFEPLGAVHVLTENVSATEPARGVIVMIVPDGAPLTAPAAQVRP